MIERVGKPYSRPLHDREAGGIDGGQFVQVSAPEIFQRSLQIAEVAGKDVESARPGYRILPRQRHIFVGVAIEKPVGSRLVVNAIVFDRAAFRFAVPDRNWTFGWRHQNDFANCFADQGSNAAL
jgi:hypothetical protein